MLRSAPRSQCSADPDALHRLLRALAALGIVREDEPGTFTLTDAGEPLQKRCKLRLASRHLLGPT